MSFNGKLCCSDLFFYYNLFRSERKGLWLQRSHQPLWSIPYTPYVCWGCFILDGQQSSASKFFCAIYGNFQWEWHENALCVLILKFSAHNVSIALCNKDSVYLLEAGGIGEMLPLCMADFPCNWGWGCECTINSNWQQWGHQSAKIKIALHFLWLDLDIEICWRCEGTNNYHYFFHDWIWI